MTKAERLEKMREDLIRMSRIERELYQKGNERGAVRCIAVWTKWAGAPWRVL